MQESRIHVYFAMCWFCCCLTCHCIIGRALLLTCGSVSTVQTLLSIVTFNTALLFVVSYSCCFTCTFLCSDFLFLWMCGCLCRTSPVTMCAWLTLNFAFHHRVFYVPHLFICLLVCAEMLIGHCPLLRVNKSWSNACVGMQGVRLVVVQVTPDQHVWLYIVRPCLCNQFR